MVGSSCQKACHCHCGPTKKKEAPTSWLWLVDSQGKHPPPRALGPSSMSKGKNNGENITQCLITSTCSMWILVA